MSLDCRLFIDICFVWGLTAIFNWFLTPYSFAWIITAIVYTLAFCYAAYVIFIMCNRRRDTHSWKVMQFYLKMRRYLGLAIGCLGVIWIVFGIYIWIRKQDTDEQRSRDKQMSNSYFVFGLFELAFFGWLIYSHEGINQAITNQHTLTIYDQ